MIIRTPVENDIEIDAANTATIAVRFNTNFDNNRPTFRDHILLKKLQSSFLIRHAVLPIWISETPTFVHHTNIIHNSGMMQFY
ncbi:hypothetical protein HBA91_00555 [Ochrobactrum sp. MR34]|nr:hypothetical protein [Ochrobactrum sp. MR34]